MPMRDGIRLATEVYRPSVARAPAIAVRPPYGRRTLEPAFLALARAGYAVVAQDCRGTGDSEPEQWDFYIYTSEPLERDLDVVGPLSVVLYASSTAEAEGGPEHHGSAYPSHLIAYVI